MVSQTVNPSFAPNSTLCQYHHFIPMHSKKLIRFLALLGAITEFIRRQKRSTGLIVRSADLVPVISVPVSLTAGDDSRFVVTQEYPRNDKLFETEDDDADEERGRGS